MVVWGEKITVYTTEAETFTVQTDQSTAEVVINSDLLGAVSSQMAMWLLTIHYSLSSGELGGLQSDNRAIGSWIQGNSHRRR